MELWIRSQNKEILMKTPELKYNQKGNDYSILGYDTLGAYRLLGIYESKERALEVLDEIVSYKNKLDKAHFLGMTESEFVSSIFEMPKE